MGIHRDLAVAAMRTTDRLHVDFLERLGVQTPVPVVPGSIGAVARQPFFARDLKRLMDLVVIFTIGDFPASLNCSTYYLPHSPWYNVFYGAYGIRSYKVDGSAWGYHRDGSVNADELLEVPFIDYNFLTAGELGCPPDRMCFRAEGVTVGRHGRWDTVEAKATIPSGLHALKDAVNPNKEYYLVFGVPDPSFMVGGRQSYEPVRMTGKMFFRPVADRTTLVWGGMCPDTAEGNKLMNDIVDAMSPLYP
ncbi:MAG: hypothetical protein ACK4N5_10775 [Myxococcales bacterium]